MTILHICPVHDFSGEGYSLGYYRNQEDPNMIIYDNIMNIRKFNSDSKIVFHVNQDLVEKFDWSLNSPESNLFGVYVNPKHFPVTHGSSQLASILTSFKHALDENIEFEYVTITHSGEMFIKHGAIDYMRRFEYGMWNPEGCLNGWSPYEYTQNNRNFDDVFKYGFLAAGFVEGSFYSKELFTKIYNWFNDHYDIETLNNHPVPLEEILIPTLAFALSSSTNHGHSINVIMTNEGHFPQRDTNVINTIRNNGSIVSWSANQFGGDQEVSSEHVYSIKRINRVYSDPIRNYIRGLS